jgi:hypothetical protein
VFERRVFKGTGIGVRNGRYYYLREVEKEPKT